MKKTKHPQAAKAGTSTAEPDEVLAGRLVNLALDLRESGIYDVLPDELQKAQAELRRTVRKCIQQRREQPLDEALERAYEEDVQAYRVLREQAEDMSGTVVVRRDHAQPEEGKPAAKPQPDLEINAFVVPIFVHTTGGLRSEQVFQDEQAFEALRDSFTASGLESRKAQVVLVSHAYHLDELEKIGYSHLNDMVLEALEAMTRRKVSAMDAIARSMSGWPPSGFAPQDSAMELRFLLGFALKTLDDPFYKVPEKEAAADRYFEARAERFRAWSQEILPVLRRCLVTDGREAEISFLYQDLFHGGLEAAVRELDLLRLLSEVRQALEESGVAPDDAAAIMAPVETEDDLLRVAVYTKADRREVGRAEKSLRRDETLESALADIADGLASLGIEDLQAARRFDADGVSQNPRPYSIQ